MLRSLFLFTALAFTYTTANAVPVFERGKWELDDSSPETPNEGVCAASTAANMGAVPYALSVIVDKAGARPIEVTIRPYTFPTTVQAMSAALSSREVYNFALLPTTQTGEDILWHIPRNTPKLIAYLKAQSQLKVDSIVGTEGTIRFSLSGSSATLKELERRCGANSLLEGKDFEALFLPAGIAAFDVRLLQPDQVAAIRDTVLRGVAAYRELKLAQAQIADLESRFATLTKEARELNLSLAKLRQEREGYQTARDKAQREMDAATAAITALQAQIVDAQARQAQAQVDLDAANSAIAPFKPEHDRLRGVVASENQRLTRAQSALSGLVGDIERVEGQIEDLQNDVTRLRAEISRLQQAERSARSDHQLADQAWRSYYVQEETRRARQNHPQLRNLTDQIQAMRPQIQTAEQNELALEENRKAKRQALDQCLTVNPDCPAERAALEDARNKVQQARETVRLLKEELERKIARRDGIVQEIERAVADRQAQLASQAEMARQRLVQIENLRQQTEDDLSNIIRFDLPTAQNQLNDLRGRVPVARSDVSAAQAAVDRATAALRSYDESVGYAALEAAVRTSTRAVSAIREEISDFNDLIEQNETIIRRRTRTVVDNNQKLVVVDGKIAPKQQRLEAVLALLAPYDQEKSDIDQRLSAAVALLESIKQEFASYLPN